MEHIRISSVFIGHLTLDDVVNCDGTTMLNTAGGASLYSSAGASIWAEGVGIVSRVGSDYSAEKISGLVAGGIDVRGLKKVGTPGISIWALYEKNGSRSFIPKSYSGDYEELAPIPADIPPAYLEEGRSFHLSPMPLSSQRKFLESGLLEDKLTILDPHYDSCGAEYHDQWKEIFPKIHSFLPSENEIIDLMHLKGNLENVNDYRPVIESIAAEGVSVIVLKLGCRGVLVFDSETGRFNHFQSCAEKVIDVTGAGDSFAGGYLAGLSAGDSVDLAVIRGLVSSSIALGGFGAFHIINHDRTEAYLRLERYKDKFFNGDFN